MAGGKLNINIKRTPGFLRVLSLAFVFGLAITQPPTDLLARGKPVLKKDPTKPAGISLSTSTPYKTPPFEVVPRKEENLEMYPCSDCHLETPVNPKQRVLKEEHEDIVLKHGGERFWCLTCHNLKKNPDTLVSMKNTAIDLDQAYLLCGQCHFQRQKDWYFGAHGKRKGAWADPQTIPLTRDKLRVSDRDKIGTWQGKRIILSCTACHNPHDPVIQPQKPSPVPGVRKGLQRNPFKNGTEHHTPSWARAGGIENEENGKYGKPGKKSLTGEGH